MECLVRLANQDSRAEIKAFLLDDGSRDGTELAAKTAFPGITILTGNGKMYWSAGMAAAEEAARLVNPDCLLWLNDDVALDPGAVDRLLKVSAECPRSIVVGAVRDPISGAVTYGGRRRRGRHPQRFVNVVPSDKAQIVDAFHGNVVLLPRWAYQRVGSIDGQFSHAYADDDYSLRAKSVGVSIILAPDTVGTCPENPPAKRPDSLGAAWRALQSPKGRPWRSQIRYFRRHGGPEWPLYVAYGYVRAMVFFVFQAGTRRSQRPPANEEHFV